MNIASAVRHVQLVDEIKRGSDTIARPSYPAIAVAVVLALIGAAMVVYMGVIWCTARLAEKRHRFGIVSVPRRVAWTPAFISTILSRTIFVGIAIA